MRISGKVSILIEKASIWYGGKISVCRGGTFEVDLNSLCNIDSRHFLRGKCLALILLSTFMYS